MIDGPMPALATLEGLRAKLRYVVVGKDAWKQAPDYTARVHRILYTHMGGGTSMSYKLFAVSGKGLSSARSALRGGTHELALCVLVALTKTMVDNGRQWLTKTMVDNECARRGGSCCGRTFLSLALFVGRMLLTSIGAQRRRTR